jgi:hypothetical protein
MPVKDEDLKIIGQFPNLTQLNLNYTDITGNALGQLSTLKKIQQISLSGTKIKVTSLEPLLSLPHLDKIFIWDTPIDSAQLLTLKNKNKRIGFETGFVDNGEVQIPLSPPTFSVRAGVIDEPKTVELKHPIPNVEIRFTKDGSEPDSLKSEVYKQPFVVNKSVTIKARAFKHGWFGSPQAEAAYIKRSYIPDSIIAISPPDPRYPMLEKDLLSDGDLGDLRFSNGQWLGYQKNEASYYLYFNNTVTVDKVLLYMLENTGAHIFPPAKLEVWGSMDNQQFKLLGSVQPPLPDKQRGAKLFQEEVAFAETPLRYIKIISQPVKSLPAWHKEKGKPAWIMISEIVVD